MKLIDARIEYTRCIGLLLVYATQRFDFIIDEVKRDKKTAIWNATHCRIPERRGRCGKLETAEIHHASHDAFHQFKPIGIARSVHIQALASDGYIIEAGKISNDRASYAILGTFWKTLHPLARWGGDFKGFADLGHFSFEWRGRQ